MAMEGMEVALFIAYMIGLYSDGGNIYIYIYIGIHFEITYNEGK